MGQRFLSWLQPGTGQHHGDGHAAFADGECEGGFREDSQLLSDGASLSAPSAQPTKRSTPLFVWPLLVASVFSVSSAGTAFHKLDDVAPITLSAWRLQLTSVLLLPGCIWQFRCMNPEERLRTLRSGWLLAASGTCLALHFGFWVWGLQHTSLAHSLLLVCCTPVILAAWALIRRQPISLYEIMGTLLALVGGAVLALGSTSTGESDVHLSGDAASLLAAILVVGYFLIGAQLRKWMPIFVYAFPVTCLAAILLSVAGAVSDGPHLLFSWETSRRHAPYVVYLACVPGFVGHTGLNTLLRHLPTLTIGLAISLEPLVGSLIGWAAGVVGPPGVSTLGGGGMVLAATIIVTWASGRREAQAALVAASGRPEIYSPVHEASPEEGGGDDDKGLLKSDLALLAKAGSRSDMTAVLAVRGDVELESFPAARSAERALAPEHLY